MPGLDFALRYYGGMAARAWLQTLWDRGALAGWELVQTIPGADNVYAADRVLRELEQAGWIERGKLEPSVSQRFFDVNGDMRRGAQPSGFCWMPVRDSGLAAFLEGAA